MKHKREVDERGEETVERSLDEAMKVHHGHMRHPNKAPSKASAAKEMRLMKKARRSFEKHEEKEEREEKREEAPRRGRPRLPTKAAKEYVS